MEPGNQDLPTWYDTQLLPSGMTEEPASAQGIYTISYNPSPSTGEGGHHLGKSYQVIQPNSAQNPTEVNLDAATLSPPSG